MKKTTSFIMSAVVCAALAMGAGPGYAALLAKSPAFSTGGYPLWFQDQAGMALQGCLNDPPANPGFCFLPNILFPNEQPGFLPFAPKVFPGNYPIEQFFFLATTAAMPITGGGIASVEFAVEGSFNPAIIANPNQEMFHRLRVLFLPNSIGAIGNYTVVHPWGTTVITPALQQQLFGNGGVRGRATIDVNFGAPLGNIVSAPNNFEGLLANNPLFTVSNYLIQTTPAPPAGFIGDCITESTVTGGLNGFNRVEIFDPNNVKIAETDLFVVCGQKVGLEVAPATAAFGVWKPGAPSTPQTFTVTNLSGAAIPPRDTGVNPPAGLILTPGSPEFSIPVAGDTCASGMTALAPGNTCTFDVVFTPGTDGSSSGTITIASAGNPDLAVPVNGTGDGSAPTVILSNQFTNTTTTTISGTVSDNLAVAAVQVSVNGGAPLGAALSGNTWSLNVAGLNENTSIPITVTATDLAQPGGNTSAPVTVNITHDNIQPAVSLTAPDNALLTRNPTQALTFTATDLNLASTIVKVDGIIVTPAPTTLGPLSDGSHTVSVEAGDSAGNVTTTTNSFTVALANGDIDGNGRVTIADAVQALRAAVGLVVLAPNSAPFFHGDIAPLANGVPTQNNAIDIADALLILRKTVGLVTF